MLYLVHGIFLQASESLAASVGQPVAAMVGLGLSFAFAYASMIWMEEPLARLRKRIEARWRQSGSRSPTGAGVLQPVVVKRHQACEGDGSGNGIS
jgi:peptidoglycan/LPS O-acetylase OafA/YrhL